MVEYNLGFSEKLADAAAGVVNDGLDNFDSCQTVLYLNLLSSEISLKVLLERAGRPVAQIWAHSHNLSALLQDLGTCEVEDQIANGISK